MIKIKNLVRQIVKGEFDCGGKVVNNASFLEREIGKIAGIKEIL